MSKVRVYEVAKQLGLDHSVVEDRCRELGFEVDSHLAQLSPDQVLTLTRALKDRPAGADLQQKRVRKTVIRRRRRAEAEEPEVEAEAAPAPAEEPAEAVASEGEPEEAAAPAEAEEAPVEAAQPEAPQEAEAPTNEEAAPPAPGEAKEPEAVAAEATPTEESAPKPRSGRYADEEAVNTRVQAAASAQPEEDRESFVKVVGTIDPSLAQNLQRRQEQEARRTARPARGPGPGAGPRGRRPGGPQFQDPMSIPLPDRGRRGTPGPGGAGEEGDSKRRKRRGGRVAYDRMKDRGFDGQMRNRARRGPKRKRTGGTTEITVPKASKRVVRLEDTITVGELAQQLSVKANEIIKYLMGMGEMVTVNHVIDLDTVTLIAQEYEFTVENVAFDVDDFVPQASEDVEAQPRDPVVTVMGHVDHGKTSILDAIRNARVAAGEAGGITQHIGAYKVPVKTEERDGTVVFLDTPGHAAFTEMRARGANVTDIVILVVAADDGVMPQTIEAINHSKAAEVPIVVALDKMDKEDADPDRVKGALAEHGVLAEDWGGDVQVVPLSAITGDGIDQLLEGVLLQAEMLELSAVAEGHAVGVVVEAELSKGRGPVATVLVQNGTLRKGDIVVSGKAMGRVRALLDDTGATIDEAPPSTPVQVLGMNAVPEPSDRLLVVKDEKDARQIVSHLEDKGREKRLAAERKKVSLDDLFEQMEAGEVKELALIIKSDVQGSLEALRSAFEKLEHPELEVKIIHAGVGPVSESDVTLAEASNAIIIGFNVRPEKKAKSEAEASGVDIKLYSVIYDAVDDVKAAMEGLLDKVVEERFLGKADVREIFKVSKAGMIAGCAVLQGKVQRHAHARLVRDGIVVYTGTIDTLRRFKDNVTEVDRGHECGIKLTNFTDVKQGDEIECFELVEVAQTLNI